MLRVTTRQIARLVTGNTQANLQTMTRLQEMISSGHRINHYADDPSGVALEQRYRMLIAENEQYQRNVGRARTILDQTDTALQDLLQVLQDARVIAQRESSGTATLQTRQMSAIELDGLVEQALGILNQTVEGASLFAGLRTDVTPFVDDGSGVIYQGDGGVAQVQIGPDNVIGVNIPGEQLIGTADGYLYGAVDLSPALTAATSLTSIRHGQGWDPGTIYFTDASGVEKSVDLSGAGTVQDIIDLLGAAGLTVAILPDGSGLQVTDPAGGPLTVRDGDGGTTARSLGITGSSQDGVLDGADIRADPAWNTALADLPALAGHLPLGSLVVESGDVSVTVDLSGATTLQEVRDAFTAATAAGGLPNLDMELDGAGLNIVSTTADVFRVSNAPGSTTATDLGVAGSGSPRRLFGVLETLRDALAAGDLAGIRRAIAELGSLREHVENLLGTVGGRQKSLDWAEQLNGQRDTDLNRKLADVRDVDLIQATSDLKQAETAYQASLMVSSRILGMNLFDYL